MVVLSGYFNSRVGKRNDLIVNDYMTVLLKYCSHCCLLKRLCAAQRNSKDKTCNSFGTTLFDFCKESGLRMCNGRC